MTIDFLLKHRAGVEAMGKATYKDGALSMRVLRVLKKFNSAIEPFQELTQRAAATIQAADKEARADLAKEWNTKLDEASKVEAEFNPGDTFKGEVLGAHLSGLELLDLDALGLLEEA